MLLALSNRVREGFIFNFKLCAAVPFLHQSYREESYYAEIQQVQLAYHMGVK